MRQTFCIHAIVFVLLLGLFAPTTLFAGGPPGIVFIRGDVNFDGNVAIDDGVLELQILFVPGTPDALCDDALDINDDGMLTIIDPIGLLNYLFVPGSPIIAEPYPFCGVDFNDDGLECNFENPHCVPPTSSFVLNAPSENGTGDDSILRIESNSLGDVSVLPFLGPAPEWNGIRFVEAVYDEVYVVQQNATEDRLLYFAPSGDLQEEYALGLGDIRGFTVVDFGLAYFISTEDSPPSTKITERDLFSGTMDTIWETDEVFDVLSLSVDWNLDLYFSGSGGGESGVFRVDPDGVLSLFLPVADPEPATFNIYWNSLWVVSTPPGETIFINTYDELGFPYDTFEIPGFVDVEVASLSVFDNNVLLAVPSEDQVISYDVWADAVVYGPASGVSNPIDTGSPNMLAIP